MSIQKVIDSVRGVPGAISDIAATPPDWLPPGFESAPRVVLIGGTNPGDIAPYDYADPTTGAKRNRRLTAPVWDVDPEQENAETKTSQPTPTPEGWNSLGTEALAWYSPFHALPFRWGVFIRAFGIEVVQAELLAHGVDHVHATKLAYTFLLNHELTHYRTELMISAIEVAASKPLFNCGRLSQAARSGWGHAEEGLANACAVSTLPLVHRHALDNWLAKAPDGYNDWARHSIRKRMRSWTEVVSDLADSHALVWTATPSTPDWAKDVPVFLVLDGAGKDGDPKSALLGPIHVLEDPEFFKDLDKSGDTKRVLKKWQMTKQKLAQGQLGPGTHFEKIRPNVYSVRVDGQFRAAIEHRETHSWVAVMADHHDPLYRRLKRKFP